MSHCCKKKMPCNIDPLLNDPWYIDPANGKDSQDGMTPKTALKTWAQLQKRLGTLTVLNPADKYVEINVLGDLPTDGSDNITWRNLLGPGVTVRVNGTVKKLASGVVASFINRNRAAPAGGQPFVLKSTTPVRDSNGFLNLVGQMIKFTSGPLQGSRAVIAKAYDPLTAELSNLTETTPPNNAGFVSPAVGGDAPITGITSGNTFDVLDYSTASPGQGFYGIDDTQQPLANPTPTGTLLFVNFRFTNDWGLATGVPQTIFTAIGNGLSDIAFADCFFDISMESQMTAFVQFGNCRFQNATLQLDGASQNFILLGAFIDSTVLVENGAFFNQDGDTAFIHSSLQTGTLGTVVISTAYFADSFEPIVCQDAHVFVEQPTTQFGEDNCTPIWGDCGTNTDPGAGSILLVGNGVIRFDQFTFSAGGPPPVPNLLVGALTTQIKAIIGQVAPPQTNGFAWSPGASKFLPPGGIPLNFNKFTASTPAGFASIIAPSGFYNGIPFDAFGNFHSREADAMVSAGAANILYTTAWLA